MIQYSKVLPIFTGSIFLFVILAFIFSDIDCYNYLVFNVALGSSAGCFGSAIIWYMKKAQIENVAHIKSKLYHEAVTEDIRKTREILKLQEEYKVKKEDIEKIDYESQMDEMRQDALRDANNTLDEAMNDATSDTNIQSY